MELVGETILQKHKGARNELAAICWLLDQGYEVFRNVSPHGAADLVAVRNGQTLFIDVKSLGKVGATAEQVAAQVWWLVKENETFSLFLPKPRITVADCGYCGKPIRPANGKRRWCSSSCRALAKAEGKRA